MPPAGMPCGNQYSIRLSNPIRWKSTAATVQAANWHARAPILRRQDCWAPPWLRLVTFLKCHAAPAPAGVLIANPPYGVRLGDSSELAGFYPLLGNALKARYAGWRCYFLSADPDLAKLIRLHASRRTPLFNGPLECRLYEYRMQEGSLRKQPAAPGTAP